jgi:hypothetical protein
MKFLKYSAIFLLFFFLFTLHFTSSTDFTQDLGRHLKIAEIILQTKHIPSTNLFSYTNPNFPFINHHWLSEIIFYVLSQTFGFSSLPFLKVLMILSSIGIVFYSALKKANLISILISTTLLSFIFLERSDVRPEMFGFLLFSVLIYIFYNAEKQQKLLYAIPFILWIWINLHITFIFGLVLTFFIFTKQFFSKNKNSKLLLKLTGLSLFLLLFNPNGFQGLFYPFNIFRNYGYTIVENQNLFFLSQVISNIHIRYFFWICPFVIIGIITLFMKGRYLTSFLLFFFFCLAFYQIRHFPFFALIAIPTLAEAFQIFGSFWMSYHKKAKEHKSYIQIGIIGFLMIFQFFIGIFFMSNGYSRTFDKGKMFGINVEEKGKNAADFMLKNDLPKNVFNNFDIGGYFIYKLYPKYNVFVDNRPEAYPADFMQNVYIRMQENPKLRTEIFKKYNIHTVFFSHTDQTPWAVSFMQEITQEKKWKLVYYDSYIMILSDQTNLSDVRTISDYGEKQVIGSENYMDLLRFASFFSRTNQLQLADLSFNQAARSNPSSCNVQRIQEYQQQNQAQIFVTKQIKKPWYCF